MKKLLPVICALLLGMSATSFAQTNVTFTVDVTDFLANGGVIDPSGVHIAGNLTTRGSSIADWTPSAGAMTNTSGNIWSITVTFTGPDVTADSLQFKYVQGDDWSFGDEGNEWTDPTSNCKRSADNNNRKLLLPAQGDLTYFSKWAECPVTSTKPRIALKASDVFPNPAASKLTVRTGAEAVTAVSIIGSNGQVVMSKSLAGARNQDLKFDVSTLPVGIYNVMVVSENSISQKQFSVVR